MLLLAVLGLLTAAATADTAVRIPGTPLRFGLPDTVLSARGFTATEPGTRKGRCRFFGLVSDATLHVEDGRLVRAEFAVATASRYETDYVHDQLVAMGYRQDCGRSTAKAEICDWDARSHLHIEVSGGGLTAAVTPASAAATAPAAPRATTPSPGYSAAERVLARLKGAPAPAETTTRAAPAAGTPPAAARAPAAASAPPPAPPPPPRPAPVPAPRDSARPHPVTAAAVPVLPETLAVRVPNRASRYAPATLLGEPRCPYPAAARAAGILGRVWVLALVDVDGRVIRAQIRTGIAALDAAALECVRDWTFQPVIRQGVPCRYWVVVPVTFTV